MSDVTFLVGDALCVVSSDSACTLVDRLRVLAGTLESPGFAVAVLIESCLETPAELVWTAREQAELRLAIEAWASAGELPPDVVRLREALCAEGRAA